MPTRSTPALDTMRTITGVGDSDRSMFPETTACSSTSTESKGRTSTSTPCLLKNPSSLATYATSPEKTGGTPGTAMETRSAPGAGPAATANSKKSRPCLLVVGVIPVSPDRPTVELQYARIPASTTDLEDLGTPYLTSCQPKWVLDGGAIRNSPEPRSRNALLQARHGSHGPRRRPRLASPRHAAR